MKGPYHMGSALAYTSTGSGRDEAPRDKLIRLSLGDETPARILEILERMAVLPFVE